jgi:hypothetical protein
VEIPREVQFISVAGEKHIHQHVYREYWQKWWCVRGYLFQIYVSLSIRVFSNSSRRLPETKRHSSMIKSENWLFIVQPEHFGFFATRHSELWFIKQF